MIRPVRFSGIYMGPASYNDQGQASVDLILTEEDRELFDSELDLSPNGRLAMEANEGGDFYFKLDRLQVFEDEDIDSQTLFENTLILLNRLPAEKLPAKTLINLLGAILRTGKKNGFYAPSTVLQPLYERVTNYLNGGPLFNGPSSSDSG